MMSLLTGSNEFPLDGTLDFRITLLVDEFLPPHLDHVIDVGGGLLALVDVHEPHALVGGGPGDAVQDHRGHLLVPDVAQQEFQGGQLHLAPHILHVQVQEVPELALLLVLERPPLDGVFGRDLVFGITFLEPPVSSRPAPPQGDGQLNRLLLDFARPGIVLGLFLAPEGEFIQCGFPESVRWYR